MKEYKLCPFCYKAVEVDNENCTFCNGFLKFAKPVTLTARKAAALNDPDSVEVRPVKEISGSYIYFIQFLSLLTVMVYCMSEYAITRGTVEVNEMFFLLFFTLGLIVATWLSFALFLGKFNGTADIAKPLRNMNFYFIGAAVVMLPWSYMLAFSGGGLVFLLLSLLMFGGVVTGAALWFVAARRMTNSTGKYLLLPELGKVTLISFGGHVIVRIIEEVDQPGGIPPVVIEILTVALTIAPFIYLAWMLGRCRKKLVSFKIENQ